jgi:hypothetical protein
MNQGAAFMSHQFKEFVESLWIKSLNSSPNYAQANEQAESSKKVLIKLIKKKIEENPRRWHKVLSEALWTHWASRHGAIKVMRFELIYGQEAMLPIEINLQVRRVAKQETLSAEEYTEIMMDMIDEAPESWFRALSEIEEEKLHVAKVDNQKLKGKSFQIGIFLLGIQDRKFGNWSPSWEGPFKVIGIITGNSYFVETLESQKLVKALNGKYLKQYFPSVWQGKWCGTQSRTTGCCRAIRLKGGRKVWLEMQKGTQKHRGRFIDESSLPRMFFSVTSRAPEK